MNDIVLPLLLARRSCQQGGRFKTKKVGQKRCDRCTHACVTIVPHGFPLFIRYVVAARSEPEGVWVGAECSERID